MCKVWGRCLLALANKACPVCQGSRLNREDAVRGRLRVIRAAAPTVFRYCCAHARICEATPNGFTTRPMPRFFDGSLASK